LSSPENKLDKLTSALRKQGGFAFFAACLFAVAKKYDCNLEEWKRVTEKEPAS
jgi:hypothetical protein